MDTDHRKIRLPASEFFKDCPWLNIPEERRGEILVEPLHHHDGLLGGASSQGDGKPSKLAALAAARRKKGSENQPGNSANSSIAILGRLGRQAPPLAGKGPSRTSNEEGTNTKEVTALTQEAYTRTMTQEIRELSIEERSESVKAKLDSSKPAEPEAKEDVEPSAIRAALPSAFAQTLFGLSPTSRQETDERQSFDRSLRSLGPATFPLLSYEMTSAELAAFAEPSPDDIVLKAQNSKGPARGARRA